MIVDESLQFNPEESYEEPLDESCVCQIGSISVECTSHAMALLRDYKEVNLNMDCPSNRVQGREFGAILMKKVDKAMDILRAMKDNADPSQHISVKCRIGVDELDHWEYIESLIERLSAVCTRFVLHARKVELNGLSPAQNRLVPPLNYPILYRICERFPDCQFWINAGIPGLKTAKVIAYGSHSEQAWGCLSENERKRLEEEEHGVPCEACGTSNGSCIAPPRIAPANLLGCMLGRAVMENPCPFWDVDRYWYGATSNPCSTRREIVEKYCHVLTTLYPRRCCDTNDQVTHKYPSPEVDHFATHCNQCSDISNVILEPGEDFQCKVSARLVGRCIKPIANLFFNLPKNRAFKRTCDEYCRNPRLRNCGPAFILRKAVHDMIPDDILDMPLKKTEDLDSSDIPFYVSPGPDWQPTYPKRRNRALCGTS